MPRERLVEELKQEKVLLLERYYDLALRINNQAGADLADNVYLGRLVTISERIHVMINGVNWGEVSIEDRMSFADLVGPMVLANPYHLVHIGAIRRMPVRKLIALPKAGIKVAGFLKLALEEDLAFDYKRLIQPKEMEELVKAKRSIEFKAIPCGYGEKSQAIVCKVGLDNSVGRQREIEISLEERHRLEQERELALKLYDFETYEREHPWKALLERAIPRWERLTRKN